MILNRFFLLQKVRFCNTNKLYKEDAEAAVEYLEKFGDKNIGSIHVNNLSYSDIFLRCGDQKKLNVALIIMKKVVVKYPQTSYQLDTYANLLYKTGHYSEAIKYETEAIKYNLTNQEFSANLSKMKNRQPTWLDSTLVTISNE